MKGDPRELLRSGLTTLGFTRNADVCGALVTFAQFVLAENQRTNLTGARDIGTLVAEHVLDSLAPLRMVEMRAPVFDLGSGAGFPGIPAAIVYPSLTFVLLEPRRKRFEFLSLAARRLALKNVTVVKSSAAGPSASGFLGKGARVLMRAVAGPERSLEIGLPVVRPGGMLVLYEGRVSRPTSAQRRAAKRAGGGEINIMRVRVPGLDADRHVWIVKKAVGKPKG